MSNPVSEAWYKQKLKIDKSDLDESLIEQPQLFQDVAEQHALAQSRAASARDERDRIRADRSKKIRSSADRRGDKLTESAISDRLARDKVVVRALQQLRDAEREAAIWLGLKEAYHQRAFILKDLVALAAVEYYATNSVRGPQDVAYESNRAALAAARGRKPLRKTTRKGN